MSDEPILRAEDQRAWDQWMRAVRLHMRTLEHRRAVDKARRVVEEALAQSTRPSVSLSGGKDSSCLTHLVCVDRGAQHAVVLSEKDDLDYPGEEEHVRAIADRWNLNLRILRPPVSPLAWIERRAAMMSGGEDIHGRSAGLSKACFYGVLEDADREHDLSFFGIRAEESGRRKITRATHGLLYELKGRGLWRCQPIADWRGIDVYAYAETHEIELLPVYRCIGFLPEHRAKPWLIRKSWWLPGKGACHGQVAWLRRYWPSLYAKFRAWFPDALSFT